MEHVVHPLSEADTYEVLIRTKHCHLQHVRSTLLTADAAPRDSRIAITAAKTRR